MKIDERHKPFKETSKKLLQVGIAEKYHTIGYLGEMIPKLVSSSMPMFTVLSAISGIPVYTKESIKEAEKAEKGYYRDVRVIEYYNEAEFRARIILFMFHNGYMDDDFIDKWNE